MDIKRAHDLTGFSILTQVLQEKLIYMQAC